MSSDYIQASNLYFNDAQTIRFRANTNGLDKIDLNANIFVQNLYMGNLSSSINLIANNITNWQYETVIINTTLLDQNNLISDSANTLNIHTSFIFDTINTYFTKANAAFTDRNLVYGVINTAYGRANSNVANINNVRNTSIAAYNQANISIPLFIATNAAFLSVNTSDLVINLAFDTANTENKAQAVFGLNNVYFDYANTFVYPQANSAANNANNENIAQTAFASVNVTNTVVSNAYIRTNIAVANINYVNTAIRTSFGVTNTANTLIVNTIFPFSNGLPQVETIASNVSMTGVNSFVLNNTNITKAYKKISLYFYNLKHDRNSTINWRIFYSGDNGTTRNFFNTDPAASTTYYFRIDNGEIVQAYVEIENAGSILANDPRTFSGYSFSSTSNPLNDFVQFNTFSYAAANYINYLAFEWATGAAVHDGTTITALGWNY